MSHWVQLNVIIVFNEYLRSNLAKDNDWEECLKYFSYCYNTSYHSSFDHNFTPFELEYARKSLVPDFLKLDKIDPLYNLDNFALEVKYRLQATAEAARLLLNKNNIRSKTTYDNHINPINIKLHNMVMIRNEARHKNDAIYKGPYSS